MSSPIDSKEVLFGNCDTIVLLSLITFLRPVTLQRSKNNNIKTLIDMSCIGRIADYHNIMIMGILKKFKSIV
jgi:hypothetical protein